MWIDDFSLHPASDFGAHLFVLRHSNPELDLPARAAEVVRFFTEWKYQEGGKFVGPLTNDSLCASAPFILTSFPLPNS